MGFPSLVPNVSLDPDERADRTRRLFVRIERSRSSRDRDRLRGDVAVLHLPVVDSLARRYHGRGESDDDLRQAGTVGLMKAIHGYRLERGTEFLAYAVPTISGELKKHFRDFGWTIRPTRRIQELHACLQSATEELGHDLGRAPTTSELAALVGESVHTVDEARSAAVCYSPQSLDAQIGPDGGEALRSLVGTDDPGYSRVETHIVLSRLVHALSQRDRQILALRFYDDLTQRQIAERIGVTQMQVSRLLARIFATLREQLQHREEARPMPAAEAPAA